MIHKRIVTLLCIVVLCIGYMFSSIAFAYTLTNSEVVKLNLIGDRLITILGTDTAKQKIFLTKMAGYKQKYVNNERMLAIIEKLTNIVVGTDAIAQNLPASTRLAFALLSLSNPKNISQVDTLLNNTSIDGVAVQIGWTSMETADDVFDWTTLDTLLATAKKKEKKVTIHIFSGAGGSQAFPLWLKNAGVKTYTLTDFQGRKREEPLPWDKTFLSQYSQFLTSLATHLSDTDSMDTLSRISVGVPVAEMDIVACRENMIASTYTYDRATYLSAWKMVVDAYAESFPSTKKLISAPVGIICFPEHDSQFFTDVMDYITQNYGNTFTPFAADLTSEGSDRMKPYTDLVSKQGLGYQTIWSSTNDSSNRMKGIYPGNLLQATCKAVSDKADYIEIYAVDVTNTDATIQKGIQAIHDSNLCK